MRVTTKLAGFLLALVAAFGAAIGIGHAVGPVHTAPSDDGESGDQHCGEAH
jgi:hypothetical protein